VFCDVPKNWEQSEWFSGVFVDYEPATLVDHQFKVNGAFAVLQAAFVKYVLGPGTTFHIDQSVSCKESNERWW